MSTGVQKSISAEHAAGGHSGTSREPPPFDYSTIPPGHYDLAYRRGRGIQSKWHHLKFQRVAQELTGYRRVLDVGCGPGTLVGMLSRDHEAFGVDITEPQIEYANRVYAAAPPSFFAGAVEDLPDELGQFDALSAVELIEHLPPEMADRTLRAAVERLRPGGKLVLTTPDFRSAWPLVERIVDRLGEVEYYVQHINRLTPAKLVRQLEAVGLREVRVRKYLFLAPFAACFGWRFADRISRLESGFVENRLGLIMLGTGIKAD